MSVFSDINNLIEYAISCGLVSPKDTAYVRNRLIDLLRTYEFKNEKGAEKCLSKTLKSLCEYAAEKGIIEDTKTSFDLFDTRIMGELTPRPSEVVSSFFEEYKLSPERATEWFYKFSQDTNYIRRDRIARDIKWTAKTEYGKLDITINLAKPEKDPRDIARAKDVKPFGYPLCPLCPESEGYSGREDFPARNNHRVIPIELCGESWCFQYSPYVYYNEHCIALNRSHVPMRIDESVFDKLFSFLDIFPHYFIGSNADLPIVGGSILSHEHFQGGRYTFAMELTPIEKVYSIAGFEDVSVGRLKWPMSVIRLCSQDKARLSLLAGKILKVWREYTDVDSYIFAYTNKTPHNTITPIARRRGKFYELDLVLRNNITNSEHPLGMFHPHEKLHHIKRENIGLIEVMGLAVLPSRLAAELSLMCEFAESGRDFSECGEIKKHAPWAREIIKNKRKNETFEELFKREIGNVFLECLKCAGVFSRDERGKNAFDKFINEVNQI